MSVQVRRRRETAAFLSTFVGAQGELLVDTTNNRVQVHDGTTPGGFPAARLADLPSSAAPLAVSQGGTGATSANSVLTNLGAIGRTAVTDANYTVLATDRTIAFTALTGARTVTLPAAAAYPPGMALFVVDESGASSSTNTITVARAGSDTINGATSAVLTLAYGFIALVSNGASKWTIIDQSTSSMAQQAASSVAITGGTITGTTVGGASGTFTTVGASGQVKGTQSGGHLSSAFLGSSGVPSFAWQATGQPADSKIWDVVINGTSKQFRLWNDAVNVNTSWLTVTRSGTTASSAVFNCTTSAPVLAATTSLNLPSYTVATLPAPGTAGRAVYCSNARVFNGAGTQEGAGSGSGGLVTDTGTAWRIAGTNITASA